MSSRSTSKGQCRFTKVGSTPLVPFDNGDSRPATFHASPALSILVSLWTKTCVYSSALASRAAFRGQSPGQARAETHQDKGGDR